VKGGMWWNLVEWVTGGVGNPPGKVVVGSVFGPSR
jgi:hypothetical protein